MADYADIEVSSTSWSAGLTLTDNVIVQAGNQPVAISTKTTPADSFGLTLAAGEKIAVTSGKVLKVRALSPRGGLLKIEAL